MGELFLEQDISSVLETRIFQVVDPGMSVHADTWTRILYTKL